MKYDAMYYIKKFDKIPRKFWTTGEFRKNGRKCALGHCGHFFRLNFAWTIRSTPEGEALSRLLRYSLSLSPAIINDEYNELGDNPRERILNALCLVNAGVKL